jgi:hypothetical protein
LALRSFLPLPCSTRITMRSESMSDTRRLATYGAAWRQG